MRVVEGLGKETMARVGMEKKVGLGQETRARVGMGEKGELVVVAIKQMKFFVSIG